MLRDTCREGLEPGDVVCHVGIQTSGCCNMNRGEIRNKQHEEHGVFSPGCSSGGIRRKESRGLEKVMLLLLSHFSHS